MSVIDDKIKTFLIGKPILKMILIIMTQALGAARARDWFSKRYEVK